MALRLTPLVDSITQEPSCSLTESSATSSSGSGQPRATRLLSDDPPDLPHWHAGPGNMAAVLKATVTRLVTAVAVVGATVALTVPASADQPPAPVPDIIGACPSQTPVLTPGTAAALSRAGHAAKAYARTTLQWPS